MVRFRVVSEMLKTEESYVRGMDKVVTVGIPLCLLIRLDGSYNHIQGILTPLRRTAQKGFHELSEGELKQVFCNVEEILNHHINFLALIQTKVDVWSPESTIGDVFLEHVFLPFYHSPIY